MFAVMPGCEAWSFRAGDQLALETLAPGRVGVLVLHGFTGTPASLRNVAEAVATAGYDVELPRLPGHGTSVDEMLTTDWAAWSSEVARAFSELQQRVDRVVVVGQSMGGTLALWLALSSPVAALVCVNPATQLRDADTMALIDDFFDDGIAVVPGEGSDIADPDSSDIAYAGTPVAPLRSLLYDGIAPITNRYPELTMPMRLFTSRQDHVVDPADSEFLATAYGGTVHHTWLERSYHVATRDYERDLIIDETLAFIADVAAAE